MTRIIWAMVVLLFGTFVAGCVPPTVRGTQPIPAGKGLIYVYAVDSTARSGLYGTVSVYCDGRNVGATHGPGYLGFQRYEGNYVAIPADPSPHQITVSSGDEPLALTTVAGNSYFIELHNDAFFPKWKMKVVDAIAGEYGVNKREGLVLKAGN